MYKPPKPSSRGLDYWDQFFLGLSGGWFVRPLVFSPIRQTFPFYEEKRGLGYWEVFWGPSGGSVTITTRNRIPLIDPWASFVIGLINGRYSHFWMTGLSDPPPNWPVGPPEIPDHWSIGGEMLFGHCSVIWGYYIYIPSSMTPRPGGSFFWLSFQEKGKCTQNDLEKFNMCK